MLQLEEKIQVMDQGVQKFFNKIDALQRKGLPGLKVINDKLMTLPDYKKRLTEVSKNNSKFAGIQGSITGKAFMDALQLDISIQHEIKHIFTIKPTFAKYTDMDEVYQRFLKVTLLGHIRWEELCDLLDQQMSCHIQSPVQSEEVVMAPHQRPTPEIQHTVVMSHQNSFDQLSQLV